MTNVMINFFKPFIATSLFLMGLLFAGPMALAQNGGALENWGATLEKYGHAGDESMGNVNLFDYGALAASPDDMSKLAAYIDAMAARAPSTMERDEAIAYWGNLYNALTVQVVAQNWPVSSIRDIKSSVFSPGPWKLELVTVEGELLSLNNIEHDILRPQFNEPRVHYVVNCASIGCPNLALTEWSAETLEADLDAGARAFVNSPRGVIVRNGKLHVSSIYNWFKEDFGSTDQNIINHLKKYAAPGLKSQLENISKISGDDYDWSVNSVEKG